MNNYIPPTAQVTSADLPFKPVRAILYALLIAVIGVFVFSIIIGIGFGLANGVDLTNEEAFRNATMSSLGFMVVDILGSFAIFMLAGRVIAKYTPTKRILISILVAIIVIAIFGLTFFTSASMDSYPIWYNVISVLALFVGIPLGAKLSSTSI